MYLQASLPGCHGTRQEYSRDLGDHPDGLPVSSEGDAWLYVIIRSSSDKELYPICHLHLLIRNLLSANA